MARTVVGHGPDPGYRPYVPEFLIVDVDGTNVVVTRSASIPLPPSAPTTCEPFELEDGLWLCVGSERPEPFPLSEERSWRATVAEGLLASAKRSGDPLGSLEALRAAAAMAGVNMDSAVAEAEAVRHPGEDLASAYFRSRKR